MAKKSESVKAFQFVFEPEGLQGLLDEKPKKVLFTVSIETEITNTGKKVGALKIMANGVKKTKAKGVKGGDGVPGCPVPPCTP